MYSGRRHPRKRPKRGIRLENPGEESKRGIPKKKPRKPVPEGGAAAQSEIKKQTYLWLFRRDRPSHSSAVQFFIFFPTLQCGVVRFQEQLNNNLPFIFRRCVGYYSRLIDAANAKLVRILRKERRTRTRNNTQDRTHDREQ